jgi:phosphohistidine phosphatase SixA
MRKSTTIVVVVLSQLFGLVLLGLTPLQAGEDTVFFVVRHADKLSDTDDTPLSDAGKKRAENLRDTLTNLRIDAIYHTDTLRSKQTAEPLATTLHLAPTVYSSSIPLAELPHWAEGLLSSQKGKRILIVGHSGTVEPIVKVLSGKQVDPIGGYDNLFIVVVSDQLKSMVRLKYGASAN